MLAVNPYHSISNDKAAETICLSPEEFTLHQLMNEYRAGKKLPHLALSTSLSMVAQAHARDLADNYELNDLCNPHSWSESSQWTSCCYTNDHKQAACMWNKPREIAGYESEGYEIVYWHSREALAEKVLEGWKKSKSHDPLIVNSGMWKEATWEAVGVGIYKNYAVVWFGQLEDPKGAPQACDL